MLNAIKKLLFAEADNILRNPAGEPFSHTRLPDLPVSLDFRHVGRGFKKLPLNSDWRFLFACVQGIYPQALGMSLCAVLMALFDLISPQLIYLTINSFEGVSQGSFSLNWGAVLALLFVINSLFQALAKQYYFYYGLLGVQACINGLNACVYDKGLKISADERRKRSLGTMVNLLGADSEAVADFLWVVVELSYSLLLTIFATISMFYFLGAAGVVSSILLILLIPLSKLLGQYLILEDHAKMRLKDQRMGVIAQIVGGIKVIKSFCWESYVEKLVRNYRNQEINIIDRINFAESISRLMYSGISVLISFSGFSLYILFGHELTPSVVFASLALVKIMEHTFANLTELIAQISVSRVASNRIQDFLRSSEAQAHGADFSEKESIGFRFIGLSCSYEPKSLAVLNNLDFEVKAGTNVAVVGEVGSGKSALLLALLGEMSILKGELVYEGTKQIPKVLWAGQKPYICNLSIAENISLEHGSRKCDQLIAWCGLDGLINGLPRGLRTCIGEQGLRLSGGQNQRLCLARAAYHDAPIVVLDDPFAAVDRQTEKLIMDELITGLWSRKTRIISTHRLQYLEKFDQIIFLDKGLIEAKGSLKELLDCSDKFREYYSKYLGKNIPQELPNPYLDCEKIGNGQHDNQSNERLVFDTSDGITNKPYYSYIKAMTPGRLIKRVGWLFLLMLSCLLVSVMDLVLNSWLSVWSSDTRYPENFTLIEQLLIPLKSSVASEIFVYGALGSGFIYLYFIHHRLWSIRSLEAVKLLHERAVTGLLGSPVKFFDRNPIGKILNRFSHDSDIVEKKLPWAFEQMIRSGVAIATTIGILGFIIPDITLLLIPTIYFYYNLQKRFRIASIEVKRMASKYKAPRLAHFKEVLEGLTVIRSFFAEGFFRSKYLDAQNTWQKSFYSMIILNRWLSLRVLLLSCLLTFGVILRLMYATSQHEIEPGTAGLILSYTLHLWNYLNQFIRSYSESEAHMIAVERLLGLCMLESEESTGSLESGNSICINSGKIEFRDVSISYESGALKAVKNVSFTVEGKEKVGIKGKSGAGKSSLVKALLRMVPKMDGRIFVGGKDISKIPLHSLRSSIAMVPQDPILFSGSVRSNLDPKNTLSSEQLIDGLSKCYMLDVIEERGGLDAVVAENGDNFSFGEKQLLCLARALLADCPIIVMDEATANVDSKTDYKIRKTLKKHCKDKTLIIIAHRLSTLDDCNTVLEIEDGCLV